MANNNHVASGHHHHLHHQQQQHHFTMLQTESSHSSSLHFQLYFLDLWPNRFPTLQFSDQLLHIY